MHHNPSLSFQTTPWSTSSSHQILPIQKTCQHPCCWAFPVFLKFTTLYLWSNKSLTSLQSTTSSTTSTLQWFWCWRALRVWSAWSFFDRCSHKFLDVSLHKYIRYNTTYKTYPRFLLIGFFKSMRHLRLLHVSFPTHYHRIRILSHFLCKGFRFKKSCQIMHYDVCDERTIIFCWPYCVWPTDSSWSAFLP